MTAHDGSLRVINIELHNEGSSYVAGMSGHDFTTNALAVLGHSSRLSIFRFLVLLLSLPQQGVTSAGFNLQNLIDVTPFLMPSTGIAAYAGATGADGLIARAFTGAPAVMILVATLAGGRSPFFHAA